MLYLQLEGIEHQDNIDIQNPALPVQSPIILHYERKRDHRAYLLRTHVHTTTYTIHSLARLDPSLRPQGQENILPLLVYVNFQFYVKIVTRALIDSLLETCCELQNAFLIFDAVPPPKSGLWKIEVISCLERIILYFHTCQMPHEELRLHLFCRSNF